MSNKNSSKKVARKTIITRGIVTYFNCLKNKYLLHNLVPLSDI